MLTDRNIPPQFPQPKQNIANIFFIEDIEEKLLCSRHYTIAGITQERLKKIGFLSRCSCGGKQEDSRNVWPTRHRRRQNIILETKGPLQLLIPHISFDINHGLQSLGRARERSADFGTEHRVPSTPVCLRRYENCTCVARSSAATIVYASAKSGYLQLWWLRYMEKNYVKRWWINQFKD